MKIPVEDIVSELTEAGFQNLSIDRGLLPYQFVLTASGG
jgi:hypothetical protein